MTRFVYDMLCIHWIIVEKLLIQHQYKIRVATIEFNSIYKYKNNVEISKTTKGEIESYYLYRRIIKIKSN